MKLEHFFRRIHANTDQLGHDGFLHWTVSSSVLSENQQYKWSKSSVSCYFGCRASTAF
jgi:hypothetical protein